MTNNWLGQLSTATGKYIIYTCTEINILDGDDVIMMSYFRFPVQSMVIEPREGRVLHGLNANELMDVQEETFHLDSLMYVGNKLYYNVFKLYTIVLYAGLIQLTEATSIF